MRELFDKMHKVYDKEGYGTEAYMKVQKAITEEPDDHSLHGQDD